jgi:hypothetical protein
MLKSSSKRKKVICQKLGSTFKKKKGRNIKEGLNEDKI